MKTKTTTKRTTDAAETKISKCEESQLVGTQVLQIDDCAPQKKLASQD